MTSSSRLFPEGWLCNLPQNYSALQLRWQPLSPPWPRIQQPLAEQQLLPKGMAVTAASTINKTHRAFTNISKVVQCFLTYRRRLSSGTKKLLIQFLHLSPLFLFETWTIMVYSILNWRTHVPLDLIRPKMSLRQRVFGSVRLRPFLELLGWYVKCSSITLKEEGELQWNHLPRGGVQLFCRPPPPHYHALLCITLSKSTFSCSSQKVRTSWKYILKCEIRCLLSKKN